MEIKQLLVSEPDAMAMMEALSAELEEITGSSGKASFNANDMNTERSLFVVAYEDEKAVGCGALRQVDSNIGEIKRIYAHLKGCGIGKEIVRFLENKAVQLGYSKLILETRKVNERAVAFYKKLGYEVCDNFGKYKGRAEAICFCKQL